MVVLKREQSVNWPGFYTDAAGTIPAEAELHVTSQASSALWRANREGSIFGSSALCSSSLRFTADDLFGMVRRYRTVIGYGEQRPSTRNDHI